MHLPAPDPPRLHGQMPQGRVGRQP